jgi:hypothetical protein
MQRFNALGQHCDEVKGIARHVSAGHAFISVIDRKNDAAIESEALEEFGWGPEGRGARIERPASVLGLPLRQTLHELHFHAIVVLQTLTLHDGKSGCRLIFAAPYLHTIGNHEVPNGGMVHAFGPLNDIINVVDFDRYAERLTSG